MVVEQLRVSSVLVLNMTYLLCDHYNRFRVVLEATEIRLIFHYDGFNHGKVK